MTAGRLVPAQPASLPDSWARRLVLGLDGPSEGLIPPRDRAFVSLIKADRPDRQLKGRAGRDSSLQIWVMGDNNLFARMRKEGPMAQSTGSKSRSSKPRSRSTNGRRSSGRSRSSNGRARSSGTRSRSTQSRSSSAASAPAKAKQVASKGIEAIESGAQSGGRTVAKTADKAKWPAMAGGAALAGLVGGVALGSRRSEGMLSGLRPRAGGGTAKNLAKAGENLGRFGENVGQFASEMRKTREAIESGSKHSSPIEILLRALTTRR